MRHTSAVNLECCKEKKVAITSFGLRIIFLSPYISSESGMLQGIFFCYNIVRLTDHFPFPPSMVHIYFTTWLVTVSQLVGPITSQHIHKEEENKRTFIP